MSQNDIVYYKKYLKYKTKYLELQKSMDGGGTGKCKTCKMCLKYSGDGTQNCTTCMCSFANHY